MLASIAINVDRDTLNPLLEPELCASLSVWAHYTDRPSEELALEALVLGTETKLASGDVDVIRLEGNRVIGLEGGLATIQAVLLQDGKTYTAEKDIVVRPFYHEYHKMLVMKIFSIHPHNWEGEPTATFEETLEIIRKTDHLTRGIPKLLNLQGYQEGGFDKCFPAWLPVDPRLKRDADPDALTSLRWLIREARKYNTLVSLHIDMTQAHEHSPLWEEYVEKDVVARDENGDLLYTDSGWGGWYHTSYTREWDEGLAQRRIDHLIEMIPELAETHTIHIDNFSMYDSGNKRPLSPWHAKPENGGIDMYKETETARKIFKYWRSKGFDVTGEGILWAHPPGEGFYGLQPYSHWGRNGPNGKLAMDTPERLSARGGISRDPEDWDIRPGDFRFGSSMHGQFIFMRDKENLTDFSKRFCTMTLPYLYLSQHERVAMVNEVLYYSDGLIAGEFDGKKIIRKGDYILVEDNNVFVETVWREREIIAYSEKGYANKTWMLPESWEETESVDIYRITLEGPEAIASDIKVKGRQLELSLSQGDAVSIVPYGNAVEH